MRIKAFRIPTEVVLPGLVVQVRLASPSELEGCMGDWTYDTEGQALIRINKMLPIACQRYTLLHELQHVMTDYIDVGLERFPKIISTVHMAAQAKSA